VNPEYQKHGRYFAQTPPGLEELAVEELAEIGAVEPRAGYRALAFEADKATLYRINLRTRLCTHVLAPLLTFDCHSDKYLHRTAMQKIDWDSLMDVDGTLGGASVTGSGQFLTGTGDASGLKLEIIGGATGDRGSVVFGRGIADQIFSLLDGYLGTDNLIDARTDGINNRIDDINDSRETLARRMASLEARYLKQFSALDALLGQMQATSSYLTSQLAALPGAYKPKTS